MVNISTEVATRLIEEQFPQWAHLEIRPVAQSGHDNRTFHLGEQMTIKSTSRKSKKRESGSHFWRQISPSRSRGPLRRERPRGTIRFPGRLIYMWRANP